MFCLRRSVELPPRPKYFADESSWLPLLFIPTNASPAFILAFFICTYFLNRPCVYCSLLLLILFFTSCNWSDNCFLDTNTSTWFDPRPSISAPAGNPEPLSWNTSFPEGGDYWKAIVDAVDGDEDRIREVAEDRSIEEAAKIASARARAEWTGLGAGWLRNALGKTEWTIECLDLKIKL